MPHAERHEILNLRGVFLQIRDTQSFLAVICFFAVSAFQCTWLSVHLTCLIMCRLASSLESRKWAQVCDDKRWVLGNTGCSARVPSPSCQILLIILFFCSQLGFVESRERIAMTFIRRRKLFSFRLCMQELWYPLYPSNSLGGEAMLWKNQSKSESSIMTLETAFERWKTAIICLWIGFHASFSWKNPICLVSGQGQ